MQAAAATVDVTDEESVRALMSFAARRFGSLDIVVGNAGGAKAISPRAAFHEISLELWEQVVALNLRSAWLCAKHAFPFMQEQSRGRIVLVSSASASTAQPLGVSPYIAAKGGVEALTRALAREAGPHGITVNAVAPGFTPVESVRELHGEGLSELQQRIVAQQARPEVGSVDDVAAAVVFLSSDQAAHITGQVLHVDGGWVMA
jgi:3-oxoacyl-[acyl-carrier protein] reductase